MSNNRTFFKNVKEGNMTLSDIFSDVGCKHTPEESARVLIAGTSLTTPDEADMLASWQKPFLFARFGLVTLACMVIFFLLSGYIKGASDAFLACMSFMVPMILLILTWEMNIPRTISLMEILKIVAVGGALSMVFSHIMFSLNLTQSFLEAPLAEEPAKFAVVYMLLKRKNRKYILEGVLLGMAVGTGFAIVETFGYTMIMARDNLINYFFHVLENGITFASEAHLRAVLHDAGYQGGLQIAVGRAFNAFAGHGFYAALYSGGLMIAKGAEPVKPKHLLSKSFLICFAISFVLHGLNNSPTIQNIFPEIMIGNYVVWSYSIVQTVIAVGLLLGMLKMGVNQVVDITIAHYDGRVTRAVHRDAPNDGKRVGEAVCGTACKIFFVAGPLTGQKFRIQSGKKIIIGRGSNSTIPLHGASNVSSTHCAVAFDGKMILVTDLGSTNGTYVDRRRLTPNQPTSIADGSTVYLANQNCAFRINVQ